MFSLCLTQVLYFSYFILFHSAVNFEAPSSFSATKNYRESINTITKKKSQSLIINGLEPPPRLFYARLTFRNTIPFCGATIIHEKFALTTAFCVGNHSGEFFLIVLQTNPSWSFGYFFFMAIIENSRNVWEKNNPWEASNFEILRSNRLFWNLHRFFLFGNF